jgi:segregation and condensation protein A
MTEQTEHGTSIHPAAEDGFTGYKVQTPLFEEPKPLDFLLYLVRRYEINIYDIPIAFITEQFIQYIALLERLDLELASEFVVMVAHLLVIKSRMLLPREFEDDDDEDPRAGLVAQLLEYQKFKAVARVLEESESVSRAVLERKAGQVTFDFPGDDNNWVDVKLFDLVNAFSRLMTRGEEQSAPYFPILDDFEDDYDPEEKIVQICTLLEIHSRIEFGDIITPGMKRGEIIIIFLAILNMIKRGLIVVQQHKLFGDITIVGRG